MKIDKSEEIRQKEARIEELETRIKRTRSTLKGLKTRLEKTHQRVEEMQREVFEKMSRMQERMFASLQRLEERMKKLRREQRLKKEDQDYVEHIYESLVGEMQEQTPDPKEGPQPKFEEEERAKYREAFQEFRVEPPQEEKQDIRKLYLRLSKLVHPDRARNEREAQQYHRYQQQVNEAYEKHDIHILLDLEQRFSETWEDTEPEAATASVDALDHRISRLEHQLSLLQQQKERLSQEIKGLRQSDVGQMLTGVDSMKRAGFSMDDTMGLSEMEEFVKMIDALESAIRDTDKRGKLSPELEDLMEFFQLDILSLEAVLDEIIEQGMSETFFGEDDEYEEEEEEMVWPENPNPKFPPGAYVRIRASVSREYFDKDYRARNFSIKGLTGVVHRALLNDDNNPVYDLVLDATSMKKLPKDYVESEGVGFHILEMLQESVLVAKKHKKNESVQEVRKTYRTLLYEHIFSELEVKQEQRLRSILLARPEADDATNWLEYLEDNLPFPFKAKIAGDRVGADEDQPVTVVTYGGYYPDSGLVVQAQKGQKTGFIPLWQLTADSRTKRGRILNDYWMWYLTMEFF